MTSFDSFDLKIYFHLIKISIFRRVYYFSSLQWRKLAAIMAMAVKGSRMTVAGESNKTKRRKEDEESDIFSSCAFSSLGLHSTLCNELRDRMGFEAPTLVQAQSIPVILSGRHVLVNAPTGTGKTVAYLAPVIHLLQQCDPRIQRSDGTFALVLVPTRELCMQVYEILQKLLHRFHWIVPGYIMGGENRSKEKARLRKGISILIATPGRLLDHLKNTSSFMYINLRWIIFDEADRILELGFGKEIEEILDHLGSRSVCANEENSTSRFKFERQNLLLSATLNEKVNHLAEISLENPVMIGLEEADHIPLLKKHNGPVGIGMKDEAPDAAESLSCSVGDYKIPTQLVQRYVKVSCGSRLAVLLSILKDLFEKDATQKVVVFFSTCDAVDFHYALLSNFKFSTSMEPKAELRQTFLSCKTFRLHGNMKQEDRRTTFQTFKSEKLALLLSTDVAARGLDFPKVRCIVQYDTPGESTEYVHRVGRTARLGEKGDSLLFLQPVEIDYLQDLEKHGVLLTEYPLAKVLDRLPSFAQRKQDSKFLSLDLHPRLLSLHRALESYVSAEPSVMKLAQKAFCSWVRAYTAHRGELKRFFTVKKLHLGHVAKSFALKEQPSLVGKSFQKEAKKRKREQRMHGVSAKKRKIGTNRGPRRV